MEPLDRRVEAVVRKPERGALMLEYMVVIAFSFVFVIMMLQFIVFQYSQGVVRGALDEGVREGSRFNATADACRAKAQEVIDDGLGPANRVATSVICTDNGRQVTATSQIVFQLWFPPGLPDLTPPQSKAQSEKERLSS